MAKKVNTLIQVTIKGNDKLIQLRKDIELYSKNLKELKKENKDVKNITDSTAQAFAKNEASLKKARAEYKTAQNELKQLGNSTKNTGSFTLKMAKAFGIAQLAVDGFRKVTEIMKRQIVEGVETFKNFEFEMAKVKAISGASAEEFEKLKKSAEDLGRSTFFTATQVAELQLNFSKLGFTATEVLQVQEAALLAATATGEDLARTATVIGSTIRGFGLDATEGARVADVMAASFTQSALTLEKFQTSMTKVSSVAALLGMDLEETTAIMGVLTDSGIEASIAGTSLRNIFLHLGDPSSDLAKAIGFTVNNSQDMVREFRKMRDEGVNVEKMLGVVERRQVNAIANMVKHIDKIEEQTASFRDSSGAAADMAGIIGDTLEGASLRFQSALDGVKIALVGESGLGKALKENLDRLALFFNKLATDNKFVDGFTNSVLALVNIIKVAAITIPTMTVALKGKAFAVKAYASAQAFANRQLRIFNVLINRNPIGLIVGLLTTAAASLLVFRDRTKDSADAQRILNDELEREQMILNRKVYDDFLKQNNLVKQEMKDGTLRDVFASDAEVLETFKKKLKTFSEQDLVNFVRFFKDQIMELNAASEEEPQLKQFFDAQIEDFKTKLGLSFTRLNELQKQRASLTPQGGGSVPANLDLDESTKDVVAEYITDLDEKINEGILDLQQQYVDGRIVTEEQLQDKIFELKLNTLTQENELLFLNADIKKKLSERFIQLKVKERSEEQKNFEAAMDQHTKEQKAAKEKEKAQMKDIQNTILHAETAQAAISQLISAKINEILLEAMSSLFADKTIPFLAQIGLAVGLKALITPLINGLLGGGSNNNSNASQVQSSFQSDLQTFSRGGLTKGGVFVGNSHSNGGVKFAVGGKVMEAEGGEAIINKKSTKMFTPMLSAINSYNGNGVKFADGGMLNNGEIKAMNNQLMTAQQLVSGGTASANVLIVESDVSDVQSRISTIESQASF